MWQLDLPDVGLPMGESDTLIGPDGELWSYLHASFQSAGVRDQWGTPAPFPGCVTLWKSSDGGKHFALTDPHCLPPCLKNPCTPEDDQIDIQQYPRVALASDGTYVMVYEWRAWNFLRTSPDGLNWSAPEHVGETRQWYKWFAPCSPAEVIGPHPFVNAAFEYECFLGGPPGIYIEGDQLYVFVGMGKHPSHMGCFVGLVKSGAAGLRECAANPLFTGATSYGPPEASGPAANPYFDFRIISSADVLRVGDHYYMTYEGVRGPDGQTAQDNQFNLGFARSLGPQIDGPWEKYPANPMLMDVPGNIGVGHADMIVLEGVTYLYTATSDKTRGRYALVWTEGEGTQGTAGTEGTQNPVPRVS